MCIRDRCIIVRGPDVETEDQNRQIEQTEVDHNLKNIIAADVDPVSYTHLDVYKRQIGGRSFCLHIIKIFKEVFFNEKTV